MLPLNYITTQNPSKKNNDTNLFDAFNKLKCGNMLKHHLLILLLAITTFNTKAELSCKLDAVGCETIKGKLTSAVIGKDIVGIYLNNELITTIKSSDVNEAFSYYDLPHKKGKSKLIEKLIISYDSTDCISENVKFRCHKFRVIDLFRKNILSNSFYPPVLNSLLINITWGEEKSKMMFEDKSEFTYEDGNVTMSNSGVIAEQEVVDKENNR
ncbi:hypothetical protein [Ewingella allii]|uniref:hypothetical protein n=1 Tax=Ewingella allii TaxID=3092550 RepID=UPI00379410F8